MGVSGSLPDLPDSTQTGPVSGELRFSHGGGPPDAAWQIPRWTARRDLLSYLCFVFCFKDGHLSAQQCKFSETQLLGRRSSRVLMFGDGSTKSDTSCCNAV